MKKLVFLCMAVLSFVSTVAFAQEGKMAIMVKPIPYPLSVCNSPENYSTKTEGKISIAAKGKTNLFNNPNGEYYVQDAPMILFEPKGDFTLIAKVSGELKNIYDVAALVVYQDKDLWAKFCYENSVDKKPTIVSVVTRGYSDDCNSVEAGSFAWMSIVRNGNIFKLYYSPDGQKWSIIRHFHLEITGTLKAGFASHGSRGNGFTAEFSEIKYFDRALDNMQE